MLTSAQKRQFATAGYLKIPGVVPQVLVDAARRAVNHSIGHVGLGEDRFFPLLGKKGAQGLYAEI